MKLERSTSRKLHNQSKKRKFDPYLHPKKHRLRGDFSKDLKGNPKTLLGSSNTLVGTYWVLELTNFTKESNILYFVSGTVEV